MIIWMATVLLSLFFNLTSPASAQEKGKQKTVIDPAVVKSIEKLGGSVRRIAQNEDAIEVDFHLGRNHKGLRQFETSSDQTVAPPSLDDELRILKELNNVISLHLGGTDVTNKGLSHVADLNSLQRLHLEKTSITDLGLAHLKGLKNLSYLNLYQTAVSDEGLKHLEGLKNLKQLFLWQSKVTPNGVNLLREVLPSVLIEQGWEPDSASGSQNGSSKTKETK